MTQNLHSKIARIIPHPFGPRIALQQALDTARTRILVTFSLFTIGLFAISIRMFTIVTFNNLEESYQGNNTSNSDNKVSRSNIVDRNGQILATSVQTSSLYANARIVLNPAAAADKLLSVLPALDKKTVLRRLQSKRAFVWLARHLTPKQKADILRLGIPGLDFRRDQRRIYPFGALTSHIIGFTDVDGNGLYGLENGLDSHIRQDSKPITLTIDIRLQHILADELQKAVDTFSAEGACGLILDIKTGEILALTSLPDFDPNHPSVATDNPMFNRATLGVYEQGSIFKIFNTALALETGVANLETQFDATNSLKVGQFLVTDYTPSKSWINVEQIFIRSSNIGSARMALEIGTARQKEFLGKIGLLQPAKLELPEIGTPISPRRWREANLITISYGYGIAVSQLQMASAVGGIVNDGVLVSPTLIKTGTVNGSVKQIISADTSVKIRKLMRKMITEGTGRKADIPGIHIAGKTGTSNWRKSQGRGYQRKEVRTSFVGVFPKNPRYLVCVMLDKPQATKHTHGFNAAGWNAAPTGGNIIKRIAPTLRLTPDIDSTNSSQPLVRNASFRP